jgi:3-deoxy-manno-octulosonate cytidylyltransferase (CMP-KDO synthetase)
VAAFGGEAVMTRPDHPSGTDRIAEVAAALQADLIVNLQGDEPLLPPEVIDAAITPLIEDPSLVMGTVTAPLTDAAEWRDPNIVKVVVDREGFALYFSRAPIPFPRDMATPATAWKHIGLYVYRRDFLLRFAALSPTILEETERLEQLRALEHGYRIKVVATAYDGIVVDTPADLARAEAMLAAQLKEKVNP